MIGKLLQHLGSGSPKEIKEFRPCGGLRIDQIFYREIRQNDAENIILIIFGKQVDDPDSKGKGFQCLNFVIGQIILCKFV